MHVAAITLGVLAVATVGCSGTAQGRDGATGRGSEPSWIAVTAVARWDSRKDDWSALPNERMLLKTEFIRRVDSMEGYPEATIFYAGQGAPNGTYRITESVDSVCRVLRCQPVR